MSNVNFETIAKIEELPPEESWVYDVEMSNARMPYFFANGVLVHNSTYFKTYAMSADEAVAVADAVADVVNKSYPEFMRRTFLCNPGYDNIIKAGREIVSDRGIFVEKKRYILHLTNLDGKVVDKMKVMGLDTKKTTLPADVSKMLNGFIERFLKGEDWDVISRSIVEYKDQLMASENIMDIGLPKGVNGIEDYTRNYEADRFTRLPGHVAASINYNLKLKEFGDKHSTPITSGMKIKVFYLAGGKHKKGEFKSIALPTDLEVMPAWFTDTIRVDREAHITRLVDNPLANILKAISKKPPSKHSLLVDELLVF